MTMKEQIKNAKLITRKYADESHDVEIRRIIRELADEDIYFIPDYHDGNYRRINSVDDMSKQELEDMEKYVGRELKKAITLIKRMRKLQKFTKSQQIKNLMGDLKLELMSDV